MALRKENILLVDDDMDILELLQRHLKSWDFHTFKAVSVKEAVQILKGSHIDLLITDIQMPEVDGLQLLKFTDEHYPALPKLVVTGYPSVDGALQTFKSGATDYLTKPFTKAELNDAVNKALGQARSQNMTKKSGQLPPLRYPDMVGTSPAFRKMAELIARVKDNKATVLVLGESGTGKELVARAIHYSGKFARAPFIAVNCAAIPENLQEAELFGHTKGAFTGASEERPGFFQAANGGTLFLDEIGSAPLAVQTKLLRALQEKEITKVGSRKAEPLDLRIVAASNTDLREDIANKTFREDLYYRLTVVEINVPPLRERKADIPLLAERFVQKYGVEYKDRPMHIAPDALRILERYPWPGNIRELENSIQRAVIMADGRIEVKDLPEHLKYKIAFGQANDLVSLKDLEKRHIERVLAATQGNKTKAAEILGIDRKTLREKLK
ncbi:sigma-54-dependent transcriptional regulator [Maribacter sp. 2307ULW6-5]|uniref:sigma-54-dependent transcriptional regulator n=1 Tax=Maribacter sp. 2307ULW6-5 TaxID=3386275 RepID=UPI0039BD204E